MGFKLVKLHGAEYWWFRNCSIALLGFIIPAFFEVDMGAGNMAYKSYLWTNSAVYGWSVTTLFQLTSLMNAAYRA